MNCLKGYKFFVLDENEELPSKELIRQHVLDQDLSVATAKANIFQRIAFLGWVNKL